MAALACGDGDADGEERDGEYGKKQCTTTTVAPISRTTPMSRKGGPVVDLTLLSRRPREPSSCGPG